MLSPGALALSTAETPVHLGRVHIVSARDVWAPRWTLSPHLEGVVRRLGPRSRQCVTLPLVTLQMDPGLQCLAAVAATLSPDSAVPWLALHTGMCSGGCALSPAHVQGGRAFVGDPRPFEGRSCRVSRREGPEWRAGRGGSLQPSGSREGAI